MSQLNHSWVLPVIFFLLVIVTVSAQAATLKITVTDRTGDELRGVSITVVPEDGDRVQALAIQLVPWHLQIWLQGSTRLLHLHLDIPIR